MERQPLLSVLIPTYNGATKFLVKVLDYVVKGISLCDSSEVEVVISNNASTDDTENVLIQYEQYPFIKHYTNAENVGFARNIVLLTDQYAKGVFGWVIGDDDLIAPQFLPYLLKVLKSTDIDFFSVGFREIRDANCDANFEHVDYEIVNTTFAGALEYGGKGNALGTFMSSAIFKLSYFKSIPKDKITNKFDSFYSIFPNGSINAAAYHDKKCGYIKGPAIFPIVHGKEWASSDNSYMIWTKTFPDLYNYILSLGVRKNELTKTYNRVLQSGLMVGYRRILKLEKVDKSFFSLFRASLVHPSVHLKIIANIFKGLINLFNKDR